MKITKLPVVFVFWLIENFKKVGLSRMVTGLWEITYRVDEHSPRVFNLFKITENEVLKTSVLYDPKNSKFVFSTRTGSFEGDLLEVRTRLENGNFPKEIGSYKLVYVEDEDCLVLKQGIFDISEESKNYSVAEKSFKESIIHLGIIFYKWIKNNRDSFRLSYNEEEANLGYNVIEKELFDLMRITKILNENDKIEDFERMLFLQILNLIICKNDAFFK